MGGRVVVWEDGCLGGWLCGVCGWVGGVEKLMSKLTSASIDFEVEAMAELGNMIQATNPRRVF